MSSELQLLAAVKIAESTYPDRCYLEMDQGNCSEQVQRWYFDNRTGLCQPFTYSGCGGNGNNFNTTMYCYHACNVSQGQSEFVCIQTSLGPC